MANCVCYMCKRPMDCTGDSLCELCEYDKEQITIANDNKQFVWLSQCCDAHKYGEWFRPYDDTDSERSGWCGSCLDDSMFYKAFY